MIPILNTIKSLELINTKVDHKFINDTIRDAIILLKSYDQLVNLAILEKDIVNGIPKGQLSFFDNE